MIAAALSPAIGAHVLGVVYDKWVCVSNLATFLVEDALPLARLYVVMANQPKFFKWPRHQIRDGLGVEVLPFPLPIHSFACGALLQLHLIRPALPLPLKSTGRAPFADERRDVR